MPPRKLWLQTRLPEFCASLWTKVFHPELSVKLKSGSALSHIGTLWRFNAVLDLVSDAKTHERAYNTPELQMVPRPSSICSKSHCEDQPWPVNADTRRIFHCFFSEPLLLLVGLCLKTPQSFVHMTKTYIVTSRKSLGTKRDTRFQHLFKLPVRNTTISPQPSTSLGMGNC